MFKVVGAFT